ncbi:spore protease YyaC [Clostridium neuense]|uniref:Spore protease YyaC n=1 Tax=Clostridium neuense TaxID=1728934 RepID=A0ABW8TGG8_9CLOT
MVIEKVDFNAKYYSYEAERAISNCICEKTKDKDEIIILCIGTSRIIGDAVGPITGTFLTENNVENVYGTLQRPVDATNLVRVVEEIKDNYSKPYIIAVDAAVNLGTSYLIGKPQFLKSITIEDEAITARSWDTKNAIPVGDIGITAIVEYGWYYNFQRRMESANLAVIYNMSNIIARAIKSALSKKIV